MSDLPSDLWSVLSSQLTAERRLKMQDIVQKRTDHIRLVLQDVHHPHNVSACLRSAEAFGISHVHTIHRKNTFKTSSVAKGVEHWLNLHKHTDIASCVAELKKHNYKIASAMPNPVNCVSLDKLPVDEPIALVFGNEHDGMSKEFLPHVDYFFTIPMVGMVESLNISVSAAISLYDLTQRAKTLDSFLLSEKEQQNLLNVWVSRQFATWNALYKRLR